MPHTRTAETERCWHERNMNVPVTTGCERMRKNARGIFVVIFPWFRAFWLSLITSNAIDKHGTIARAHTMTCADACVSRNSYLHVEFYCSSVDICTHSYQHQSGRWLWWLWRVNLFFFFSRRRRCQFVPHTQIHYVGRRVRNTRPHIEHVYAKEIVGAKERAERIIK